MPRTPEDEDFLLQRAALAPLAEPPEELAPLVPEAGEDPYATKLTPDEQVRFKQWVAEQSAKRGRDVSKDTVDYDLQGQFKANPAADSGHMPDTFKKPNHPTFSDESQYSGAPGAYRGGHWEGQSFAPSVDMLKNGHEPRALKQYMDEAEPNATLKLPPEASELGMMPTEPDADYMALPPAAAPKVAPLQAKDPYGPGADRAALEAAIKDRASTDNSARFMDAIESLNHAGGGTARDLGATTRARRDDSFNDVMRRRALADQDSAAVKRQKDAEYDAALGDGGSDLSANARDLFLSTTVGRNVAERMGDRFNNLSAKQLGITVKDLLASETDLAKARLKASNSGSDEVSATLEALAQRADEKFPGQGFGDKIRKYDHNAKGLAAAKDVVHQDVGQKFSREEGEKGRTNTTAVRLEDERVRQDDKRLSRLQSLGNAIKPEEASVLKIVKDLVSTIEANTDPKTGEIEGVGLGHTAVQGLQDAVPGIVGTAIDAMKPQPAQDVQHALTLAYSLERKGITGVVFTPRENAEYKLALNNISNGHNVKESVKRLVELSEQAVNRLYAAHPDTWRQYVKANPNMSTSMFNDARPEDPTEVAPAMNPPASGTAGARGINPAGFTPPPPLPTKTDVKEPDRYNLDLNAAPKATPPPPEKPGLKTMQLPNGSYVYVPPEKVEEAKAKYKAKPVPSGRR